MTDQSRSTGATALIPPPDPHRCPACGSSMTTAVCPACGADLRGPAGRELWTVDQALAQLSSRRQQLVRAVRAANAAAPADALPSPPVVADPSSAAARPAFTGTGPPATSFGPPRATGPQVSSILLGLGVTLLVIAALVFAAVSWNRMGALGQGAMLVGLTVAAGAGASHASRRHLTGTAEALGVLTVVMGPLVAQAVRITLDLPDIDDRTWGNLAVWSWWPAAILVIGVAAVAFGRSIGIRGSQYLGVVLVQLGPVIWAALAPMSPSAIAAAIAGQSAVVAIGPAFTERKRPVAGLWAGGAAVTWVISLLVGFGAAVSADGSVTARTGVALALLVCATAAAGSAWRWRLRASWADAATAAAATATALAIGRALAGSVPEVAWWPAVGAAGVVGLAVADRVGGIRSGALRVVSWVTTGFAALPVVGNGIAVLVAAGSLGESWHNTASGRVVVDALPGPEPAWLSAAAGIVVLVAAVAASHRRLDRRALVSSASVLVALGLVLVPPLAGGSLGLVVALTLAAALMLAGVSEWGHPRLLAAGALVTLGLGVVWAQGSVPLVLIAVAVAIAMGAAAVLRGLANEDTALAFVGAGLTAVAIVAEAGIATWAVGADEAWSWAVASITAAVAGAALPYLGIGPSGSPVRSKLPPPPTSRPAGTPATVQITDSVVVPTAGAALVVCHLLALLFIDPFHASSTSAITSALVVGVVALASISVRIRPSSTRWWVAAVAAGAEALALLWFRLEEAGVLVSEAYTLPLAVLLGASALLAARGRGEAPEEVESWRLEGPALAMALGPTVLIALGDPGITRQVGGLAAGGLLLAVGAILRRRAPFDIGAVAVVVLGLQALLPYADQVPRWVSLGTVGALLVLLGATFEQRRRDVRQAKDLYAALR